MKVHVSRENVQRHEKWRNADVHNVIMKMGSDSCHSDRRVSCTCITSEANPDELVCEDSEYSDAVTYINFCDVTSNFCLWMLLRTKNYYQSKNIILWKLHIFKPCFAFSFVAKKWLRFHWIYLNHAIERKNVQPVHIKSTWNLYMYVVFLFCI